jgi:hypothetical protein
MPARRNRANHRMLAPRRSAARATEDPFMTQNDRPLPGFLWRLARRVAAMVVDCRDTQHRAAVLRASADRYLLHPEIPPDTYAEFLFRTSGPLLREPTATARSRGQTVR